MTLITGTVQDIGYDPMDGIMYARPARFRTSGEVVLAPERVPYDIVAGALSAEVAPGPATLDLRVGDHARRRLDVVIPDQDTVTLSQLIDEAFPWTPAQVSQFAALRDEAQAAAGQAVTAAGTATTAAQQTGQDRTAVASDKGTVVSHVQALAEPNDAAVLGLISEGADTQTKAALNATYALKGETGGVSANSYGASPEASWETNRDAFQAANDEAAANGGGVVTALPGTYLVKGIVQDGGVKFDMPGVTLKSPDGHNPGVLTSRVRTTPAIVDGIAVTGGLIITVDDPTGIAEGVTVAVEHAGGILDSQWSYLTTDIDDAQTDGLVLAHPGTSWYPFGVLQVGDELIRYTNRNATTGELSGITRGYLGTAPTAHTADEMIGVARHHYATVVSVTSSTVTIDDPVVLAVPETIVHVGALAPKVGTLRIDGNAPAGGSPSSVTAFAWPLASGGRVGDLTVVDSDHGGVILYQGARHNTFTNLSLHDCGIPSVGKGSALWFYQGASDNTVQNLTITGDTYVAVYWDDRTSAGDPWDAAINHNTILGYNIDVTEVGAGGPAALTIVAGNGNRALFGSIRGSRRGISIAQTHQGIAGGDSNALPGARDNEIGSAFIDVAGQPYGILQPGNIVHNVWFTDRSVENPDIADGNTVYASRVQAGGGRDMGVTFPTGTATEPGIRFTSHPGTGLYTDGASLQPVVDGTVPLRVYGPELRLSEGVRIATGNVTGSRIGLVPSQKLAFWGGTPSTQPEAVPDATDAASTQAQLNTLLARLRSIGIIAT